MAAMRKSRPRSSVVWDELMQSRTVAGIPRDTFESLFDKLGESDAIEAVTDPCRPYVGIPVWSQPEDAMDVWQQWETGIIEARSRAGSALPGEYASG